jgi:hypothetical protein
VQVGELFISLGLKGADVVEKGIKGAKDGMGALASMSLEAKAAVLALTAALEEGARRSLVEGTDLVNFSTETGIAIDKIGALKNEFRQFGSGAESGLLGTLKQIQSVITDVRFNEGTSGEFNLFKNLTGADPEKMKHDSVYVLEKARELAHKLKDDPQGLKKILKGVGISDENVVAGLMRGSNDLTNLKPGNIINASEAATLDKTNIQLLNLWDNIKKFAGHETVKFGPSFVKDLIKVTEVVLQLTKALLELGNSLGVFKLMDTLISSIADKTGNGIKDANGHIQSQQSNFQKGIESVKSIGHSNPFTGGETHPYSTKKFMDDFLKGLHSIKDVAGHGTQNHASNTTVNIHGVEGAEDAVSELKRAIALTVPRYNRNQVA